MKTKSKPIALFRPKAMTIYTADGTLLDFGSQAESPEEITEGMTATIEGGGTPDGPYIMPDGAEWLFSIGTLVKKGAPSITDTLMRMLSELKTIFGIGSRPGNRFPGRPKLGC